MKKYSTHCTRLIAFDAAHRVIGHAGQCKMLHGHRYTIEAKFESSKLNDFGMVIDFGNIKALLKKWVDQNWDHNTILHIDDKEMGAGIEKTTGQKVFYMSTNPTAENMAAFLIQEVCPKLFADDEAVCVEIKLYETPNCYAQVRATQK
jgi:6-pyruvoyltetrahydropterin/6-carboxytetrahydropterin synthase